MITYIGGIPGSGKNVLATHLARKHYKKNNNKYHKISPKKFSISERFSIFALYLHRMFEQNYEKKLIYGVFFI